MAAIAFIVAWLSSLLTLIYLVRTYINYRKDVYYAEHAQQVNWEGKYRAEKRRYERAIEGDRYIGRNLYLSDPSDTSGIGWLCSS
jgi:hypothetical protein